MLNYEDFDLVLDLIRKNNTTFNFVFENNILINIQYLATFSFVKGLKFSFFKNNCLLYQNYNEDFLFIYLLNLDLMNEFVIGVFQWYINQI